jgi:DNA-binding transcriptional LysR family regulator
VVSVRSINLNLIPILQALLREESVARGAEQVGLSQPAMSGALARLRDVMGDPLLVRVGRTMRLTPRAERMRKQLDQICADIERLFQPESFDAATAELSFIVAAPDYLVFLLSEALLPRLREQAPGIRIRFVDVPADLPNWLEETTIDLAVCGSFGFWPDLKYEQLFRDRVVAAVADNHPLLALEQVSSADLTAFPSLNYDTRFTSSKREKKLLTGLPSLDWAPQITTSQFIDAVLLAAGSPTVARAPASIVVRLSQLLPLATIELSDEETEFDTGMFWAPVLQDTQEHVWLRGLVKDCLAPFANGESAGRLGS